MNRILDRLKAWWYGWERRTGLNPRTDVHCEWCKGVKYTDEGAVWCEAHPEGRLVRLCLECKEGCAGG